MAIVKMSEFKLLTMNTDVDELLRAFQIYKDVSFAETIEVGVEGFEPVESHYDFSDNMKKQEHIQSVLKSLGEYRKKNGEKKPLITNLNVKNMSYEELEQGVKSTDLDEILDTYSEFYERPHQPVEGFKFYIPWEIEVMDQDELKTLENQVPMIGTIPGEFVEDMIVELEHIKPIYYMYQHNYEEEAIFVVIAPEEYHEAVEIIGDKYELEKRSAVSLHIEHKVQALEDLLQQNIDKRQNIKERISKIGHYQDALQMHYEYLRNEHLSETIRLKFYQSEHVTLIRGWVASDREEEFKELVASTTNGVYDLEINPAERHSEEVPIKLKNNKFNQAFEAITNMYSQPRYDELDPTPLLAPFYAMFFGMMLADFGYGLVMGILAYGTLKLINLKPSTENMIRLLGFVSIPTMLWGLIYGSFFGGIIPLKPLIDINNEFLKVLLMALGFGIFHLFTGLAIKGYIYIRDSKKRYVLYDVIFWYVTIISVLILVSQLFTDQFTPYKQYALVAMVVGMVGIVLTNGREAKSVGGKMASGMYALYGITNYIGDIVSYSRLMALGLAGASIGVAFNMMVELISGVGIVGPILGALVFIGGHTFNLLISGLSSYVHSARLTYVEFFGKFLPRRRSCI